MALHKPPQGEFMIGHIASADCPCKPTRTSVTGTRRSKGRFAHQGYNTEVVFQHHPMPTNEQDEEDADD